MIGFACRDNHMMLTRRSFLGTAAASLAALCTGDVLLHRHAPSGPPGPPTAAGWRLYRGNPVLGGALGTCFDVCVLPESGGYRMWFSWRDHGSIGMVHSLDGFHWDAPTIVLGPRATGWEDSVNRPAVLRTARGYEMWYTGQTSDRSRIGHAVSPDGMAWSRAPEPVLSPIQSWEKSAVMCPDVMWDPVTRGYRMWYSGGDQYEPDSIGYALSQDGVHWKRPFDAPILRPDLRHRWERSRVTACHVVRRGGWHVMFYIGFEDENTAQIGVARSRDGIRGWQRHPANPIIRLGAAGSWDSDAVYKPSALPTASGWLLWFNGRSGTHEQIGVATHPGLDLGWDEA
jgi:hypothetical protein